MNLRGYLALLLLLLSLAFHVQATPITSTVDDTHASVDEAEDHGAQQTDDCVICLRSLDSEHQDAQMPHMQHMLEQCAHDDQFHPDCLRRWLRVNNSCPVCRQPGSDQRQVPRRNARIAAIQSRIPNPAFDERSRAREREILWGAGRDEVLLSEGRRRTLFPTFDAPPLVSRAREALPRAARFDVQHGRSEADRMNALENSIVALEMDRDIRHYTAARREDAEQGLSAFADIIPEDFIDSFDVDQGNAPIQMRTRPALHPNIPARTNGLWYGSGNHHPHATIAGWYTEEKHATLARLRRNYMLALDRRNETEHLIITRERTRNQNNVSHAAHNFGFYLHSHERIMYTQKALTHATTAFLDDRALALHSLDAMRNRYFPEGTEGYLHAMEAWNNVRMVRDLRVRHVQTVGSVERVLRNFQQSLNLMSREMSATARDIAALKQEFEDLHRPSIDSDLIPTAAHLVNHAMQLLHRLRLVESDMEASSLAESGETEEQGDIIVMNRARFKLEQALIILVAENGKTPLLIFSMSAYKS